MPFALFFKILICKSYHAYKANHIGLGRGKLNIRIQFPVLVPHPRTQDKQIHPSHFINKPLQLLRRICLRNIYLLNLYLVGSRRFEDLQRFNTSPGHTYPPTLLYISFGKFVSNTRCSPYYDYFFHLYFYINNMISGNLLRFWL